MTAAEKLTSSELPEVKPDAAKDFFALIMSGELADLSEDRLAALGTREDLEEALEYKIVPPGEPQEVHRTPVEHLAMVSWERTPLTSDVEPVY